MKLVQNPNLLSYIFTLFENDVEKEILSSKPTWNKLIYDYT